MRIIRVLEKLLCRFFCNGVPSDFRWGVIYIQCHSSRYVASLIKSQSDCNLLSNDKKKEFSRFNLTAHMTPLADISVKQLDNILVGAVVSVGAAGAYRVIKQIATISTRLTSPLNQVLCQRLMSI